MGIKLNATSGGGSVELDVPNSVSSDITFTLPAALGSNENIISTDASGNLSFVSKGVKIVNVYSSQTQNRSSYVTATAGTSHHSSVPALFGTGTPGRVYADAETITLTPEKSTNYLLVLCSMGFGSLTATSSKGAHGAALVKDDTSSWDFGNYPHYDAQDSYANYPPGVSFSVLIDAGNTNSQTYDLKVYAYNESSGDDNHSVLCRDSSLVILELER